MTRRALVRLSISVRTEMPSRTDGTGSAVTVGVVARLAVLRIVTLKSAFLSRRTLSAVKPAF